MPPRKIGNDIRHEDDSPMKADPHPPTLFPVGKFEDALRLPFFGVVTGEGITTTMARIGRGADSINECMRSDVRAALNAIWLNVVKLIDEPERVECAIEIAGYAQIIVALNEVE